jgi:hypothetical protein
LDTPVKEKHRGSKRKKSRSTPSEESDAYVNANPSQSEYSSDEPLGEELSQDIVALVGGSKVPTGPPTEYLPPLPMSNPVRWSSPTSDGPNNRGPSAHPQGTALCAMCGNIHQGTCGMTDHSENLVHYRQILLTNQTGESSEERVRPSDK